MSVIVAVGCGSDDEGAAPELWCDGVCTAVARCGIKVANCSVTCVQQNPELASHSASGAAAQKPCLARLTCEAVGGNETAWQDEQKACWEQAVPSVAGTDRARPPCPAPARA